MKGKNYSVWVLYVLTILFGLQGLTAQNVNVGGAVTGNGTYPTLTGAFTAINAGVQTGANITIDIVNNTSEPVTGGVLNAGAWNSVLIRPQGGAWLVSAAVNAGLPLIDLNGADNVTFEGFNSGGNSLTFSNTTVSATAGTSTIRFRNDATLNLVARCSVLGSFSGGVNVDGGTIYFATGTSTGNDNNNISQCNIGPAGSNLSSKGIYSNGTSAAVSNNNINITDNNIYDYFSATTTSSGVYILNGSTDITIQNNRFYQTSPRTQTTGSNHSGIRVENTSGNNFSILNNVLGYSSPAGTGTYSFTGLQSSVLTFINLSVGTTTPSTIQGNTITNIAFTGSSYNNPVRLINVIGSVNTNNNILGSSTVNDAITYTSNSTNNSVVVGYYGASNGALNVNSNIIGGISVANSSTGNASVMAMFISSGTGTCNIQSNQIGGSASGWIRSTSAGANSYVHGISVNGTNSTVTNNTITGLYNDYGSGINGSPAVGGIVVSATFTNHTVSENTIHSLGSLAAGVTGHITGIYFEGSNGTNSVSKNQVHSLVYNNPNTIVIGIQTAPGTCTYSNNMVRLGLDPTGASITNGGEIYGIYEFGGDNSFYHNSIYIGGTGVTGNQWSRALWCGVTSSIRIYRNNIFVNARSRAAGSIARHYAIYFWDTSPNPSTITSNNNIFFASGVGGYLGHYANQIRSTLTAWQTASSLDMASFSADPQYLNPNGSAITGDLHINPAAATVVEQGGVNIPAIATDIDNQTRSGLTPTDIGADAGNFILLTCSTAVGGTISPASFTRCSGQTVSLTSTGASSGSSITYQWMVSTTSGGPYANVSGGTGATTTSYTSGALVAGTYYYVLQANCGAGFATGLSNEVVVTVNTAPNVTISSLPNDSVCQGSQVILSGSGANTYTWTGGVTNNVAFTPSTTATYTVTGTAVNTCTNTATIQVVVNPVPSVTFTAFPNDSVCAGQNVTLTGSGANTYTWTGGINNGVAFAPSSTGTYTVTGTTIHGCTNTSTVVIRVGNIPVVGFTSFPNDSICAGSSVTLFGTGASSYSWSNSINNGVAFNPAATGTYTVTGTTVFGCTNSSTATVTLMNLPTVGINATPSGTVCTGTNVTLSATGANTYMWTGGVMNNVPFPATASQIYTVTGTTAFGCSATNTASVSVNSLPVVSASAFPNDSICAGSSVTLTGSGANGYVWSSPVTNGFAFVPSATATYTVTGTDGNGCSNSATITVTVISNPNVISVILPNDTVCSGNNVSLVGMGAASYVWSGGVTNNIPFSISSTSTYTVTGTSIFGCSNTATATVTVMSLPVVGSTISPTGIVCSGANVTFSGTGANTYTWTGGVINNVPFPVAASQTYTVTGTTVFGCTSTNTISVNVNPLPVVNFTVTNNDTICNGGSVILNGTGADSYGWSGGVSNGVSFSPTSTSTYTVTGTDGNGCSNTAVATITVNALPPVGYTVAANDTVCPGEPVTLTGTGAASYSWSNGITDAVAFTPASSGSYVVTGTDAFGCTNTATAAIVVGTVPNVNLGADVVQPNPPAVLNAGAGFTSYLWSTSEATQTISVNTNGTYSVTVTNIFGCTDSDTIQVFFTSGVINPDGSTTNISLYPNPNNGPFNVRIENIETSNLTIEILDMLGKVVYTRYIGSVSGNTIEAFDMSELRMGAYTLRMTANGQSKTLRFIIGQ